jgi:cytoskeleton protein RodZ
MSAPATPPGPRLKAEREHRGLSAQKAADELHLDRWVIDALESGDYQRIGPTVYAKGHLKKYAALLGLPAAEIVAGYESRALGPVEQVAAGPSMLLATRSDSPDMSNLSPAQIVGFVLALALIVGVLVWRPWHQRGSASNSMKTVAAVVPAAPSAATDSVQGGDSSANPTAVPTAAVPTAGVHDVAETAGGSAAAAAALTAGANPDPGAVAGAGHARLRLSFSADSWVDVHDASGKRTFAGNGLANSVKTIAGTAPMRVYLGFGSGVQLEINDRVVAIGPQFFAGDVARFEAGADGVLRRDSHGDPVRGEPSHGAPPRGARPPG